MVSRSYLCVAVLAVGSLMLAGCGTAGSKRSSGAVVGGAKTARAEYGSSSVAAMDKRAKAHAHYAAGVVYELNEETGLALEEFSKAALADPEND